MSEPEPLRRQLTLWGIFALVINGLIGAGIFGVGAEAARLTGGYSPAMFVLCALIALPLILSFAELSSYFRGTGGPIRYAREGFGDFAGFQTGWMVYLARATSYSANLVLLVNSLAALWPPANMGVTRMVLLALIAGGLTVLNVVGTDWAIKTLSGLTVLKLIPLIGLVVLGLGSLALIPRSGEAPPPSSDVGEAALVIFYAYVGFTNALIPAGEAKEPERDMPRALFLALGSATVLYVLIQAVSMGVVEDLASSSAPLIDVGRGLLGPTGGLLIAGGIVLSVGGNLVASAFSAPRITYALAREGDLPAFFGRVHQRFNTPHVSVIVYGVFAFAMAAAGSFVWLAKMSVLVRVLFYVLCIAALPRLRARFRHRSGTFVLPGGLLVPALGILVSLWLLLHVKSVSWLTTAGGLAVGCALYFTVRRKPSAA
ncbi:MAG: APC family permease [Myxococcota bacterium]